MFEAKVCQALGGPKDCPGFIDPSRQLRVVDAARISLRASERPGCGQKKDVETALEFAINPAGFRDALAADLPETQTAVMAATQRPVAELAFSEPFGPPASTSRPTSAPDRGLRGHRDLLRPGAATMSPTAAAAIQTVGCVKRRWAM